MNEIIVSKVDSGRLLSKLKMARQNKTCHVNDAERLTKELEKAKLTDPESMPGDVVTMNSLVRIYIPSMNVTREIKIVYPEDASLKENKISIFAPMATALLGYRKGDEVEWNMPAGKVSIIIEEILYQPEAAGDFEL
ncbi:MAG: nucleoside diphosphate kinase regulator [Prolixibacteraceae bacterium]|nr:nucleoside diphosphate kinase regulator [Prolixibacteraceae bacterium]